ncbi:MAG: transposase family protein [Verrucomicrobia bacterium]|nr:transposase family protein [Verrucomicrobiota bacterium]
MSKISRNARDELIGAVKQRYSKASKEEKTRILDEFVALTGFHRKHAVRVLSGKSRASCGARKPGLKIYNEAVREAMIVLWEAADRICSKRLKPALPCFVNAMECHGHLQLAPEVRARVLAASPATIDRLLAPIRRTARTRKKRRPASKASKRVPVKTFADWEETEPGFLEIDFVLHSGGSLAGSLIHTFSATDVESGWVECIPLLAREQSLVAEAMLLLKQQFPIRIQGINSDNDSAFINDTLTEYCDENGIKFTRSRAYRKNDQAWIEQKNGSVVRRLVGYERYSGVVAGQVLARLYQASRLYTNYFQPSLKLREKVRIGAKVRKSYHKAATPCARLLAHSKVSDATKQLLRAQQKQLDPVDLLHKIREHQAALAALTAPADMAVPSDRESLEQFLSALPRLWRAGEVRPTHRKNVERARNWRTREDPFKAVWPDILTWLEAAPDMTAKELFDRVQTAHPGQYPDSQLRTLQRRVREWRHVMAKQLVYACIDGDQSVDARALGTDR